MTLSEEQQLLVWRFVFRWLHNIDNKAVSSAAAWLEADLSVAAWIDENFSCCLCSDPGDDRPIRYFTLCPRHQERTRDDTDNLIWCTNRHSLLFPAKFLCDICKKPFCENCTMIMQGKTHCEWCLLDSDSEAPRVD